MKRTLAFPLKDVRDKAKIGMKSVQIRKRYRCSRRTNNLILFSKHQNVFREICVFAFLSTADCQNILAFQFEASPFFVFSFPILSCLLGWLAANSTRLVCRKLKCWNNSRKFSWFRVKLLTFPAFASWPRICHSLLSFSLALLAV